MINQTLLGPDDKKIADLSKKVDAQQILFEKNDFPYAIEENIEHVSYFVSRCAKARTNPNF